MRNKHIQVIVIGQYKFLLELVQMNSKKCHVILYYKTKTKSGVFIKEVEKLLQWAQIEQKT